MIYTQQASSIVSGKRISKHKKMATYVLIPMENGKQSASISLEGNIEVKMLITADEIKEKSQTPRIAVSILHGVTIFSYLNGFLR